MSLFEGMERSEGMIKAGPAASQKSRIALIFAEVLAAILFLTHQVFPSTSSSVSSFYLFLHVSLFIGCCCCWCFEFISLCSIYDFLLHPLPVFNAARKADTGTGSHKLALKEI